MKAPDEFLDMLRSGDRAAYAELVAQHQKRVLNICYRFLLDRADAEDTAQEVFIEVFQSIKSFRGEAAIGTWIYRIAVTRSLDALKKRGRRRWISRLSASLGLDAIAERHAAPDRPDILLEEKEGYHLLLEALNSLPESQRIAFTLSKVEGFGNAEIAALMQVSVEAVESLLYRARQNLIKKTGP